MLEVVEVYILQMWRPDTEEWFDIKTFDLADLAHDACDAARSVDHETRWRIVRRWH